MLTQGDSHPVRAYGGRIEDRRPGANASAQRLEGRDVWCRLCE